MRTMTALTFDPWAPIEERGELLITIARWSGVEWQVRIVDAERHYRAEHIAHVHCMGPVRGPCMEVAP